jgi:hypothetical protein
MTENKHTIFSVDRDLLLSALTIVVGDTIIKPKFREYPLYWTSKDFEPYSRLVLDYVVENSYHREGISIDFSTMCNDVEQDSEYTLGKVIALIKDRAERHFYTVLKINEGK